MLNFPNIDPVIVSIGPVTIYWYSIAYVIGILFGWYYSRILAEKFSLKVTKKDLEDFVSWAIIGIILGGRLGYVIFYNPAKYLQHPIDILKTYEGGMSFHGGLVGLIIAVSIFCKKHKIPFAQLIDLMAIVAPIGLFLGRIANFINGEIYGRITDVKWAIIFPNSDNQPRHPSQLYEAVLEGLLLFIIIQIAVFKFNSLKQPGKTSGIFLVFYSIFRIFSELYREPDLHIGFLLMDLTLGQILSIPMLLIGLYIIFLSKCRSTSK